MSLRKRTLIIIGLTIVSLIVVLYATSRIILLGSFAELEERDTRWNVERALSALSDELSVLDTTINDWAARDDTYAFIENPDESYIQSNLIDGTFITLRLNLMLFVHSSGRIVFGKAFDLQNEEEVPVPQSLQEHLTDNALLLRHPTTESSITGIVLLPEGPMLIASRPILTGEDEGPIRGTLMFGRYLDSAEIERLAGVTRLSLTVRRFEDPQMPLDFQAVRSSLLEEALIVRPLSAQTIAGYALLKDIYGKPALVLRVDMPREIYEQGQASMRYFILSLLAVGLVFGMVTLLLLERQVLSRLTRLSKSVSSIGASGDLSARVAMAGTDELSSLADEINGMLEALEQSEEVLRRRLDELTALHAIAAAGTEATSEDELLEHAIQIIGETLHLDNFGVILLDPASGVLHPHPSHRLRKGGKALTLRLGEGIVGQVALTGQSRRVPDVRLDPDYREGDPQTRSELCVPLKVGDQVLGVINTESTQLDAYTEDDERLLTTVAGQLATAIEKVRLFEETRRLQKFNQSIVQNMSEGIAIEGADGILTFVNPAAAEMLGYAPEELLGQHWTVIVPPDQQSIVQAANERRRRGQADRYEVELVRKDGTRLPVLVSGSPRFEDGRFVGTLAVFTDITERKRAEEELRQSLERLQRTLEGTIHALASAVEMRDPYTAGHQRRVAQLACAIAKEMGLPEERISGVLLAGLIHDIGKINMPAEILSKPGRLNELEYGLVKTHSQAGYEILNGTIEFPWPVAQIVLQHHERMDGSGYPQGLKGEEILLEARVLAVADVVEAMVSYRPYRSARGVDQALREISQNRGILYDPEVVDACLKLFTEKGFTFNAGAAAQTTPPFG